MCRNHIRDVCVEQRRKEMRTKKNSVFSPLKVAKSTESGN